MSEQTIDLTPTREGYLAIGAAFATQVISDVTRSRRADDVEILRSLLDIAYSAGFNQGVKLATDEKFYTDAEIRAEREAALAALLSRVGG